jgi:hypothetical protein
MEKRMELPIQANHLPPTTGPYSLEKIENNKVTFKRNPFYPKKPRANEIERASYQSYSSGNINEFIEDLNPKKDHLIYFFGHLLSEKKQQQLIKKGYGLNYFSSEWLIFLTFNAELSLQDRKIVSQTIDPIRDDSLFQDSIGQPSYSIVPADRPFGLNREEYEASLPPPLDTLTLSRPLILGALEGDEKEPSFLKVKEALIEQFPDLKVRYFAGKDHHKMRTEADILFDYIGISPADPLSLLFFLLDF